jgi:hypothetical protein
MGEVLLPGRRISADWGGLPSNLDAALTPSWAGGRTYFFKVALLNNAENKNEFGLDPRRKL